MKRAAAVRRQSDAEVEGGRARFPITSVDFRLAQRAGLVTPQARAVLRALLAGGCGLRMKISWLAAGAWLKCLANPKELTNGAKGELNCHTSSLL